MAAVDILPFLHCPAHCTVISQGGGSAVFAMWAGKAGDGWVCRLQGNDVIMRRRTFLHTGNA